jgi:hypothetical protein
MIKSGSNYGKPYWDPLNKYSILLIIILLTFCVIYLIYRSLKDDEIINNIDNNIEKYFNFNNYNLDSDDYSGSRTRGQLSLKLTDDSIKKENQIIKNNKVWDGTWLDINTKKIYGNFFEINDKIIIYLSHYNINNQDIKDKFEKKDNGTSLCPPNTFLGIGNLNENKTFFILSKILCNNFNLDIQDFTGSLDINNKTIILNKIFNKRIILNKIKDFNNYNNSSNYLKLFSNIIPLPNVTDNSINILNSICSNNNIPCIFKNSGLAEETQFKNKDSSLSQHSNKYNACGINRNSDNTCKSRPTCVFYSKPITINNITIPVCKNNSQYTNHLNYMTTYPLINSTYQSLEICDYLKYFNDDYCNSSIICYISNLGDVKTLNYDYFNILQNNLTLQYDIFNDYLNNSANGLLYNYRKKIIEDNKINDKELLNIVYFTNLIEKNINESINYKDYLNTLKNYINNYENMRIQSSDYKKLFPALWKIKPSNNNSCSFKLSTNPNYNSKIKYVDANEYNDKITLNLYEGGFNQNLYLENVNLIKNITPEQSTCMDYINHNKEEPAINSNDKNISCPLEGIVMTAITGNIKTHNNKYLVPNDSHFGFQNNTISIKLSDTPPINGKWFIFGFNIRNKLDTSVINDLIKIDLNS